MTITIATPAPVARLPGAAVAPARLEPVSFPVLMGSVPRWRMGMADRTEPRPGEAPALAKNTGFGLEPFDIQAVFRRLRAACAHLPKAAMFQLRDEGYHTPTNSSSPA